MRWSYPHTALACCTGAYFAVRVGQLVLGPVLPAVTAALDLSTGLAGVALSGMWAAYAVAQLPSGLLAERVGERATVLLALAVVAAGGALLAGASSPGWFAAGVAVLGAGAGLYYNAGAGLLAAEFDAVGAPIGLHKLGSRGAGLVAPALATAALAGWGWRAAPLATAGLAVGGAGLVAGFVRPASLGPAAGTDAGRAESDGSGLRAALWTLRRPVLARTTVLTAGGEFVEQALFTFLPTFLVAYRGLSIGAAGALFAVTFAFGALTGPLTGWLADRFSPNAAATLAMSAGVAGLAVLLVAPRWALVAGVALAGVSLGWTAPLQSRVLTALGDDERGGGFGAYRTVYLLVGSLGSAVVGVTAGAVGWPAAIGLLAAVLGAGVVALLAERAAR